MQEISFPSPRFSERGWELSEYIGSTFTEQRRQRIIDSCPPSLRRNDGQPALLYRHVSEQELIELLMKGKKDGHSGILEGLSLTNFYVQFNLRSEDPNLLEHIAALGFTDPEKVLQSVTEGDVEEFKNACKDLPTWYKVRMVVRGVLTASFFGYISTSLIPFGATQRYHLELMIPPEKWHLDDLDEIQSKEMVYDREMQVLVESIAESDITMIYKPGEMAGDKSRYLNSQFNLPPDTNSMQLSMLLDKFRSGNKKEYLPEYFQ